MALRLATFLIFLIGLNTLHSFSVNSVNHSRQDEIPKIDKKKLLGAHNFYRKQVNVMPLDWSDSLAKIAQNLADSMTMKCVVFDSDGLHGESSYWSIETRSEEEVVDYWAIERKHFDRQGHKRFMEGNEKIYGHYTQIVWASTTHVGAAKRECSNGNEIWVCVYDPSGNIVDENAY